VVGGKIEILADGCKLDRGAAAAAVVVVERQRTHSFVVDDAVVIQGMAANS
jgi:hypothetical protein